jgi:hypothetical protein
MQKELIRETQAQAQFPKWVIRAVSAMSARGLSARHPGILLIFRTQKWFAVDPAALF